MTVGKTLLAYRTRHQLNQKEFAAILGVSQSTLSRWERGLFTEFPPDTMQRINSIVFPRKLAGTDMFRLRAVERASPITRMLLVGETYRLDTRSMLAGAELGADDRNLQDQSMLPFMHDTVRELIVHHGLLAYEGKLAAVSLCGEIFSRLARVLCHYHIVSGQLVTDMMWTRGKCIAAQNKGDLTLITIDDIVNE